MPQSMHQNLRSHQKKFANLLCVGLDPWFQDPPAFLKDKLQKQDAEIVLYDWCRCVIDQVSPYTAVLKPQAAFFESYGSAGWSALEKVVRYAKDKGMFVLLDAKRGEISGSMKAYGTAYFERMQVDAMTVTPWMGVDVLTALDSWLRDDHGVYLVWVTSNKTANELQAPLVRHMFDLLCRYIDDSGLSESLGFVVGATKIEELDDDVWDVAKQRSLLMPGVGPQGGKVEARLDQYIRKSLEAEGPPGLVPVSRGITGLGDPKVARQLNEFSGWTEYATFVRDAVQSHARLVGAPK